jgi:predicted transcriptional regulator of viral defense system
MKFPHCPTLLRALRSQSRAVFKRLGFLAEGRDSAALSELCRARLTAGNAKLDPALACKRLISRWRLLIPPTWAPGGID